MTFDNGANGQLKGCRGNGYEKTMIRELMG